MNKNLSISVILPVYNEEGNIKQVVENSADFLQNHDAFAQYEIIVVDDGSNDNTANILRELAHKITYFKVITHYKNFGYGKALISGLGASQYPLVLFMDADGQLKISEINKFILYIEDYDIITGYRYKRKDNLYRTILGKTYSWLVFLLFGFKLKDINCGFKLFRKKLFEGKYIFSNSGSFFTEVFLKLVDRDCKIKEIPIEHSPRLKGRQTGGSFKVILSSVGDLVNLKRPVNKTFR